MASELLASRWETLPEVVRDQLAALVLDKAKDLDRRLMAGPAGRNMLMERVLALADSTPS